MSWLKYQWQLFCLAVSFFSRLPIPASTPYSSQRMNRAGRYFALVGSVIGALCAGAYWLSAQLWPDNVAVMLTMVFSLLLTGAFHEDGLTDMADGIGGGMTLEKRLSIMKDSRIGTYGASALVMALLAKYVLLCELSEVSSLVLVLISAYTVSRAFAASLIFNTEYVADLNSSKSKPLAEKQTRAELMFLVVCALVSMVWFELKFILIVVSYALAFRFLFKKWLLARLGGFTGDCLGAAQQLMELQFYLLALGYWAA